MCRGLFIVGMHYREPKVGYGQPFGLAVAKQTFHIIADKIDPLRLIIGLAPSLPDNTRDIGDQPGKPFLFLLHLLGQTRGCQLGLPAFGNIAKDENNAAEVANIIANRCRAVLNRTRHAIARQQHGVIG